MRKTVPIFLVVLSLLVVPVAGGAAEGGSTTGAVWGTVVDAVTERPVAGLCVRVFKAEMVETEHTGSTNADGVYEIAGLAPGEYILQFDDCERDAYATMEDVVSVTAGGVTEAHQWLALRDGVGSVLGFVHDASSKKGLAGACVTLFHAEDDIVASEAITGSDGGYQVNAPVGDYRLRFKGCEAGAYETQWYDHADSWETSSAVSVGDHTVVAGVDADLKGEAVGDAAVVWGYVIDGVTGEGVAGYCVSALHGETKSKTVLTGPEGGYEMAIDPVEARIKAWPCEGHADLGVVWYIDGLEYGDADVLSPAPGSVTKLETMIVGDVRFSDTVDSGFHDDIVWLAGEGITTGCSSDGTKFCPDDEVTRGQMAAFLRRALADVLEAKGEAVFSDDDGSVFEGDIEWLASVGVTAGCGEGVFCPDAPVSRGQMAAFLHRALADVLEAKGEAVFSDDDGSVFEGDIEWLASVGVTAGCGEGVFCPDAPVSRGQMAAFLHRALGN